MKLLTRSLSLLTIASLVLIFANCGGGGGEESTKEKKELARFKKTWTLTTATLDGSPRTTDFAGFKLIIGGDYNSDSPEGPYTYQIQGSTPDPSPWPASGTWIFSSITSSNVLVVRDPDTNDEIGMSYKILSNGNLELTMDVPDGSDGWRVAAVSGEWVFTFTAPSN